MFGSIVPRINKLTLYAAGPYTGAIGTLAGAGRNRGVVFLRSELHFISQGDNRGYQREVEWPVT